jgi:1,4-dihydroxy-2-naphthoate octaprenyltransferase
VAPKQQRPKQQRIDATRSVDPRNVNGRNADADKTVRTKTSGRGKSGNPAARRYDAVKKATLADWIDGSRVRTLPLSISPVIVGTGAAIVASEPGVYHPVRALLCLIVSVALQIGVNFANDYSDGIRGTDDNRVGPQRLVGSGKASAKSVLTVALVFFGIAAVAGLVLTVISGLWWLLIVGAAALVAAWFYTGGKRPYGYNALGEVFVFVFFGLVATLGTTFVQVYQLNQETWFGAIAVGFMATAALVVNNLRDIEQDRMSGKRTLSVLIGATATRVLYIVLMLVPFVIAGVLALFYPAAWFAMFVLLAALPACIITATARTPRELILVLKLTGVAQLFYAIALFVAFWLYSGGQ